MLTILSTSKREISSMVEENDRKWMSEIDKELEAFLTKQIAKIKVIGCGG